MAANEIVIPYKWHRFAPCKERACGHESCERLRTIAASPCLLCRKVIGYGVTILDERTERQQDAGIFHVGFTHRDCRRRWKATYTPRARKPSKPAKLRPPLRPTEVHLDDDPVG